MTPSRRIRILHVITGLDIGGAEMSLYRLLRHGDRDGFEAAVVSLGERGELADRVERLGIPVLAIGASRPRQAATTVRRVAALVRERRPDIVQTWMYHADLLGGLAARWARTPAVVWNLRASDLPATAFSRSTRAVIAVNARLSRVVPARIVCVSEATRRVHAARGYDEKRMVVIRNGVEVTAADPGARRWLREMIGAPPDAPIIVRVARYHPQKDFPTLLDAAARLRSCRPDAHWVLCGDGVDAGNEDLAGLLQSRSLHGSVHLLGPRTDVARIHAAADVACSLSTFAEGFPNVVAEAMEAGTPVVVTDVGDSAALVGDTGPVVPPGDAAALAQAIGGLLALPAAERAAKGEAARRRVRAEFGVDTMVERYQDLYRELV